MQTQMHIQRLKEKQIYRNHNICITSLNTTPPQSMLITPPRSPPAKATSRMRTSLLRILPLLILPAHAKQHHPHQKRHKHGSDRNPRQDQEFLTFIRVQSDVISMFVDNAGRFVLDDGDDDGGDEEAEEGEGSEGAVGEREDAAVEEDGQEGGEN